MNECLHSSSHRETNARLVGSPLTPFKAASIWTGHDAALRSLRCRSTCERRSALLSNTTVNSVRARRVNVHRSARVLIGNVDDQWNPRHD